MKYSPIDPISHQFAEHAANGSPDELARAIVAIALHDDDFVWAEAFCEQFATHPNPNVRGAALLGFGHLARRFLKLDSLRVQPLLIAGLSDADSWVRGQAVSAVDDVNHFLGWRLSFGG